jgi:hypothetical protein
MDPYIEASGLWEDFHATLIVDLKQALSQLLPDRYFATVGERFYIVASAPEHEVRRQGQADVSVDLPPGEWTAATAPAPSVGVAGPSDGPLVMTAFVQESFRETFLEIRELENQRLVTALEILSPTNKKPGSKTRKQYLRKRQAYIEAANVGFLEFDLLRGGVRMPMREPWPSSPYYLLVNRPGAGQSCLVWPAHFLWSLPPIPVPLAKPDPDLTLNLQPLIDTLYERSRYHQRINYRQSLKPPLDSAAVRWLEQRLLETQAGGNGSR